MTTRIQLRRGTAAEWTDANPVLALGEAGIETDSHQWKTGDGVTAWNSLPYMAGGGGGGTPGGANTQVQFNDSGVFGGQAGFTFDKIANVLQVPNTVIANSVAGGQNGTLGQISFPLTTNAAFDIVNNTGNIIVITNSGGYNQWIFDVNGNLTLPGNTFAVNYANGTPVPIGGGGVLPLANGTSNFDIAIANGNVTVTAAGTNTWTFGTDGNLTFPDNSGSGWPINQQRFGMGNIGAWLDGQWTIGEFSGSGVSGQVGIRIDPGIEGNTGITLPSQADSVTQPVTIYNYGGGNVKIDTNYSTSWTFDTNGLLTLPSGNVTIGSVLGGDAILSNNVPFGVISQGNTGATVVQWSDDVANTSQLSAIYVNGPFGNVGDIQVRSGNVSSPNVWTFDTTGALNLTNNGVIRQEGAVNVVATDYAQLQWVDAGNINIPDPNSSGGPKNWAYVDNGGFHVETNLNNGGSSYSWDFDTNGNFTTTANIVGGNVFAISNFVGANVRTNLTDFNWSESITGIATGATTVVTLASNVFGDPWTGQVTITGVTGTTEANATWWYQAVDSNQFQLYTDSSLSTPVDSSAWGAYVSGGFAVTLDYGNIEINAQNITIRSDHGDYNNKIWTFNRAGQTVFPYQDVARGDNPSGNITGYAMVMGDGTGEAIISTPDGNINGTWSSQRLVINPGKGGDGTSGEGGDIYLWAGRGGDQGGSGGDIKIRGGQGGTANGQGGYIRMEGGDGDYSGGSPGFIEITGGSGGVGQNGGYVRIQGGQGQNSGGDANITGGVGQGGPGGPVNIVGGVSANGLAEYGNVNITSGASTWTFDNTGTLNLPGGTGTVESSANNISIYSDAGQLNGMLMYDTGAEIYALQDFAIFTDNANASHIWRFYANGIMTAPGAINVGNLSIGALPGYITADANTGIILNVSGPDGGFVVDYLKEDGNANTSGGELAFSSELGNATYRISLSDDLGNGFATKIWRFDGTGNLTLPSGGSVYSEGFTPSGAPGNTIILNPHGSGSITNQKLMVYPTAGDGDHIHMTTGNLYETELFLGSDDFYVKLANTGNVVINSNDGSGPQIWTFDSNGGLNLTNHGVIRNGQVNSVADSYSQLQWVDSGNLNLADPRDTGGPTNWLYVDENGIHIETNINVGAHRLWNFGLDGNLTIPGNSYITVEPSGSGQGGKTVNIQAGTSDPNNWNSNPGGDLNLIGGYASFADGGGGNGGNVNIYSGLSSDASPGNVTINTGDNIWTFSNGGSLTIPGPINGEVVQTLNGEGTLYLKSDGLTTSTVQISTYHTVWTFDQYNLTQSAGNITVSNGNITAASTVTVTPKPYADLTAVAGARAFVNDANLAAASNFGAQISGGGSNTVPVWSDGTHWYIG